MDEAPRQGKEVSFIQPDCSITKAYDGGRFVAVTFPPSSNTTDSFKVEAKARPLPSGTGDLIGKHIKDVEGGIYLGAYGEPPVGDVNFECYYWKKELYVEAAREEALKGEQEWGVTKVPERYLKGKGLEVQVLLSWRLTRLSLITWLP